MIQHLGEYLKKERRKAGLSVDDVASSTKLRKSLVLAIEEARFDELGADVYAKGYIKSYARLLGLDQEKVLAMYRREQNKEEKIASTIQKRKLPQKQKFEENWYNRIKFTQRNIGIGAMAIVAILFVLYAIGQVQSLVVPPRLVLTSPVELTADFDGEIYVAGNSFRIEGETDPQTSITFNSQILPLEAGNLFSTSEIPMASNSATVVITATNQFGLTSSIKLNVRKGSTGIADDTKISASIEVKDEVTNLLVRKDGIIEFNDRAFPGDLITLEADNVLQIESQTPYNLLVTINGQEYTFTERTKTWENIDGNIIEK